MAHEYRIVFEAPTWYAENRDRLVQFAVGFDRFVRQVSSTELWLRDDTVDNSWPFDLRLFFKPDHIDVEVSTRTATFFIDVAAILAFIRKDSAAALVDDDGVPVAI